MFVVDKIEDHHFDAFNYCFVDQLYEISAETYLQYSREDFRDIDNHSQRHVINAISNAKKALHIRMEELARGFGYQDKSIRFPQMYDYLKKCGFSTPRSLEKINTLRNKVEHEYTSPNPEYVEIYLDIVELFIDSSRKWMERCVSNVTFMSGVLTDNGEYELAEAKFLWSEGKIEVVFRHLIDRTNQNLLIDRNDNRYFPFVALTLRNDR